MEEETDLGVEYATQGYAIEGGRKFVLKVHALN